MIVEFCGVPGAGKSYLAGALATDLRALGHAVSQPLEPVSPRRVAASNDWSVQKQNSITPSK